MEILLYPKVLPKRSYRNYRYKIFNDADKKFWEACKDAIHNFNYKSWLTDDAFNPNFDVSDQLRLMVAIFFSTNKKSKSSSKLRAVHFRFSNANASTAFSPACLRMFKRPHTLNPGNRIIFRNKVGADNKAITFPAFLKFLIFSNNLLSTGEFQHFWNVWSSTIIFYQQVSFSIFKIFWSSTTIFY